MAEAAEAASAPVETNDRRDVLAEQFAALETAPPAEASKPDRSRDEAGKFAIADKAKPVAGKAPPKPIDVAAGETAPQPVPDAPWKTKPPQSWRKDYHEVWQTLPDNVREYTWQREEQMKSGIQPLLEKAQFADSINQTIEPFQNTIRGLGLTPVAAIKGLMEADHVLRNGSPQQKLAEFGRIAQAYGVDLRGLTGQASQAPPVDPNYHALLQQLNAVRGEVRTWQEQQETATNQGLQGEIAEFAQAHEHFEAVKPVMAALLQGGQAKNLDEAYKKAVRLDDELYESEVQARQAKERTEKDRAAKAAKAAAVSVRGSTPGSNTATKAQTRRERLIEGFGELDSRI